MLRRLLRILTCLLVALAASACHRAPHTGLDFTGDYPERLSEWRLLEQRDGKLAKFSTDLKPHECTLPALPPVTWPGLDSTPSS